MIIFELWEGVFSDFQEYFLKWNYFYGDVHFLEYYSSCLFYFTLFFWVWSIKSGGCLLLAASSESSLLLGASYYASHRSFGLVLNTYVCSQQSERERKKRVSYLSLLRFQIIPILQPSCTVEGDGGKRLHSPCTARDGVPGAHLLALPPPSRRHAAPGPRARRGCGRGPDPSAPTGLPLRAGEQPEPAPPGARAAEEGCGFLSTIHKQL